MPEQSSSNRDLILAPSQSAILQDETKGNLTVYVGPNKTSLAQTDRPVKYNPQTRQFQRCSLEEAIMEFPLAVENAYIVLENPSATASQPHPKTASSQQQVELIFGRKVNIAGPATFPLWPGQTAKVIDGHRLRSNQYLIVRVYNEEAARANWSKSVVKPAAAGQKAEGETKITVSVKPVSSDTEDKSTPDGTTLEPTSVMGVSDVDLTIGKLLVIKGTEVSFYIPPTGIEVVTDSAGNYVRDAVTLERLEYCMLLDESGDKRIVKGRDVVFPTPTETFIEKDGQRKFKAIELNDDMGIYVKVIEAYTEGGKEFETGQELFITGRDQRIYYPREEHAIIKYGDRERHFGVVIPDGEARYVLDKETGKVGTTKGPKILLTDPRHAVIVRRVLEDREVCLWYPGNEEARQYNAKLRELLRGSDGSTPGQALQESLVAANMPAIRRVYTAQSPSSDEFQRGSSYTPPRTLTLDTKYEGAVAIGVWANTAIMVANKTGSRRTVLGPQTALLDYDESLQVLELSTGKPKTTDKLERTVYLRICNNQVSDILELVTRDMVSVKVKLSYRVNFEGNQPEKWFAVENYVKFLTDHARSVLRQAAKQVGIEKFNNDAIPIIRDAILGVKDDEGSERPGLIFRENGMRICDVEVLTIDIGDEPIRRLLVSAQTAVVHEALRIVELERKLEMTKRTQGIEQQIAEVTAATRLRVLQTEQGNLEKEIELVLAKAAADLTRIAKQAEVDRADDDANASKAAAERQQERLTSEQQLDLSDKAQQQRLTQLTAEVKALVDKAGAISPHLVSALQSFGDRFIAVEAAKAMGPMALLGGTSVAEVLGQLLKGTALEKAAQSLGNGLPITAATRDSRMSE